jgi:magnesium-transporting ATPase (P-type)
MIETTQKSNNHTMDSLASTRIKTATTAPHSPTQKSSSTKSLDHRHTSSRHRRELKQPDNKKVIKRIQLYKKLVAQQKSKVRSIRTDNAWLTYNLERAFCFDELLNATLVEVIQNHSFVN